MKKIFIVLALALFLSLTAQVRAGLDAKSGKVTNVATPIAGTDGANKQYVDDTTAAAGHNILSVAHGDTTNTGAPTRGSMMIASSTPKWAESTIGAAGTIWRSDGTDPSWAATTNITTLGTIVTGVWNATAVDISDYTNLTVTAPVTLTDDDVGVTVLKDIVAGVGLSGGENDVLPGADADTTLTFDATELDAITWSDGANASNIWTFDVSGTDHTMTAGNNLMTFSNNLTATGTITGGTLTDGTLSINSGSITSAVNGTFSGDLQCDEFTLTSPVDQDYKFTQGGLNSSVGLQAQDDDEWAGLDFFSKKGDGGDSVLLQIFGVGTPGSIVNRETLSMFYSSANTDFRIRSNAAGTGTLRPLTLYTGTNTSQLVLRTDGTTSFGGQILADGGNTGAPGLAVGDSSAGLHFVASGNKLYLTTNGIDAILVQPSATEILGNLQINGALNHDGSTAGFYGTAPITKPTGVAVSAAGIHAALVSLGLIAP